MTQLHWMTLPMDELSDTLHRIFSGRDFASKEFGPAKWLSEGSAYTTLESIRKRTSPKSVRGGKERSKELVRYDTMSGKREVLLSLARLASPKAKEALVIAGYAWSEDEKHLLLFTNAQKVWRQKTRGDYWICDLAKKRLRQLGGDAKPATLMFAKFSPDGTKAAYVRENNLYVETLASGRTKPLTKDGSTTIINGMADWVNEEEFGIRDGFRWSPNGTEIAYWQFNTSGVGEMTLINNTDSLYPVLKQFPHPKAGTQNSAVRIGIVTVATGRTRWLKLPGNPRENYVARIGWVGETIFLTRLNRLQNTQDLLLANPKTGSVRRLFRDRGKAWVEHMDEIHWTEDEQTCVWLSERDGWRRAYAVSRSNGKAKAITPKRSDVLRILAVGPKSEWLYFIASPDNATERYLYRSRLDGTETAERLTPQNQPGTHGYQISPDCRRAFHSRSTFDRIPVTNLIRLPSHEVERVLEPNTRLHSRVRQFLAAKSEFFQLPISPNVTLDGWMIRPRDFHPSKKYPVLVYVYGEPVGVTVTNAWQGKRGLFHRALANEGFVIASFDNRGTPAPKGRAWRKIVYGSVGVLSSKEQALAIQAFARRYSFVDRSRIAVWGWSGGGSMTLNLLFRYPKLFHAGISIAPEPDQLLYDTIYQERYMKTPRLNSKGYHDGSPINFAKGLQGKLLLIHGSADDNCHLQGAERTVNRLIELGKPFDFFVYPNRSHSLDEGKGTLAHLYQKMGAFLKKSL